MDVGIELVDADSHVNPAPTFWDDYLPAKFAGRGPRWEPGGPGDAHDWLVFEGARKPLNLMSAVSGQGRQFLTVGRQERLRAGNWEPAARLADMDQDGVRTAVMYGGGPLGTADNDLYLASFDAYNRWLADFCAHDRSRLIGVAYLPMQDVTQSTAMVRDAAQRGLRGVNIPAFPQSPEGVRQGGFGAQALALTGDPNGPRQYDDPQFDVFWRTCVEHDMAVTIHLGARIARPGQSMFLPNMVMSKLCMAEPIAILIFGGVFDRFPELRFGTIESGAGKSDKRSSQEAILDAAEILLGRHGPDGVSLCQIAAAAGSANHFAVQYHFKTKEGLIREIFERRLRSLEAKRGRLLASVARRGCGHDAGTLLEVLLRPIADEYDAYGQRSYAAFLLGLRVFSQVGEHWAGSRDSARRGPPIERR
jgi:predicted TIM-barrel fold metal-dependent hydrolase